MRVPTPEILEKEIAKRLLAPMGVLQDVEVHIDNEHDGWNVTVRRRYPGWESRICHRMYVDARPFICRDEAELDRLYWTIADTIDKVYDETVQKQPEAS
jgi:hypothetical protein